jgi:hypothetical protein
MRSGQLALAPLQRRVLIAAYLRSSCAARPSPSCLSFHQAELSLPQENLIGALLEAIHKGFTLPCVLSFAWAYRPMLHSPVLRVSWLDWLTCRLPLRDLQPSNS